MKDPTAAILIIGDEILSGRTREGNANWLAGRLTDVTGDPRLSGVTAASAAVASVGCLAVARWHRNVRSQRPVAAG